MAKPILGHIFGVDLNELQFVCDSYEEDGSPVRIENGEIVIIDDAKTKEIFLARIVNIKYGQRPEWMKEVARGYNRMDRSGGLMDEHEDPKHVYLPDRKDQLFLIPSCEILGYIDGKEKFLSPKKLPSYFSSVRKPEKEDFVFLEQFLGDVSFGKVRSGSAVIDVQAGLFGELFPKHIGVFAQTGGGKSNYMQRLIGSILELEGKYGMLLFEPHGEYIYNLKRHPYAGKQLVSFSQDGKEGRKLRIAHEEISVNALMNVRSQMKWSDAQERFMREAESKFALTGDCWFTSLVEMPVTFADAAAAGIPVSDVLKEMFPNVFEDTIRVTQSKLQQIAKAPYLEKGLRKSDSDEIMSLLDDGKVVLIDMASLSGLNEILLSTILSAKLLGRRRNEFTKDREGFKKLPPVSIVLEEAQRVLGRDGNNESNIFAQICNEGRKFGVGLIAITQQPKLMNEILISQFNTLVILSISDETDFRILSGISKKPLHKLQNEIRSLMPGEAIVTSPLSPFAMPVKVDLYEDYVKRVKKPEEKKLTKKSFEGMV